MPPAARPRIFPIAHGVSAARALPGSGAVTLSAGLGPPREGWGDAASMGQHPAGPRQVWVRGTCSLQTSPKLALSTHQGTGEPGALAWGWDAGARSRSPLAGGKAGGCWAWGNTWQGALKNEIKIKKNNQQPKQKKKTHPTEPSGAGSTPALRFVPHQAPSLSLLVGRKVNKYTH